MAHAMLSRAQGAYGTMRVWLSASANAISATWVTSSMVTISPATSTWRRKIDST